MEYLKWDGNWPAAMAMQERNRVARQELDRAMNRDWLRKTEEALAAREGGNAAMNMLCHRLMAMFETLLETFDEAPEESRTTLVRVFGQPPDRLAPEHFLFLLDKRREWLLASQPELVIALLEAAFKPTDQEHDAYEVARGDLHSLFNGLLDRDPVNGTIAFLATGKHIVPPPAAAHFTQSFTWRGRSCRFHFDNSWPQFRYPPKFSAIAEIWRSWSEWLASIPQRPDREAMWETIAGILADEACAAYAWHALLLTGSRRPEWFAEKMYELLLSPVLLTSPDTRTGAAACISAFAPFISDTIRWQIAAAVLTLEMPKRHPEELDPAPWRQFDDLKYALLSRIPETYRSLQEQEFIDQREPPRYDPLRFPEFPPAKIMPYTRADFLADAGVDMARPEHRQLYDSTAWLDEIRDSGDFDPNRLWLAIEAAEAKLGESPEPLHPSLVRLLRERLLRAGRYLAMKAKDLPQNRTEYLRGWFRQEIAVPVEYEDRSNPDSEELVVYSVGSSHRQLAARGLLWLLSHDPAGIGEEEESLWRMARIPEDVVQLDLAMAMPWLQAHRPQLVEDILQEWQEAPTGSNLAKIALKAQALLKTAGDHS